VPILTLSALSWYLPRLGLRIVVFISMVLIAVGFLCMRTLGTDASFVDLLWPLLVLGAGAGIATAPTTSAIMMSAPDEKHGVASAVNDVTRASLPAVTARPSARRSPRFLKPCAAPLPSRWRNHLRSHNTWGRKEVS
jgi:hypothetical protein